MTDFRWTGREGEKLFDLLCSRRMVTCNKADEDDRGWDFILHFPPPSALHVPIDQRSAGPTALVQIKATRVDAQRWSISLKNALSLMRSPLPAFVVRVGLDAAGQETFRAVHLWRYEIARTLKAARQAHVDGDEAINHRSVSFELGPDTERPDVLAWMLGEIERVGEAAYAAAKQLMVDTLGFEDGHGVARIRFSTGSPDALADLQLGLLSGLDLDSFSFTPSRFGIEASSPEIEVEGCRLEVVPRGRRGALRLRSPEGRQEIVPVELLSAALPGRRRTKIRITAGFLDVVVAPRGRFEVRCRINRERRMTLDQIAAIALLRQSSRASPLRMSLRTDGSFADLGTINLNLQPDPGWGQLLCTVESLRRIAAFEGVEPISTSIDAIDQQFVPLSVIDALVADRALRIEFTPVRERDGVVGAFLAHATARFDGSDVGAVATQPVTSDTMIGTRRRINFGPARILHASIGNSRAAAVRELYLDELDRLSATMDVLAVGDLQRAVDGGDDRELLIDEPRKTPTHRLASSGS